MPCSNHQWSKEGYVLALIQDMPTRWTASLRHAAATCLLYNFVHSVLGNSAQKNMRELTLATEEVYQMRELATALQPLCEVMQGMGSEQYSSIALIQPMPTILKMQTLTALDANIPVVFDLKNAVFEDLKTRCNNASVKSLMMQTTLLNSRFKDFRHIHNRDQRTKLLADAKNEILFNLLLMKLTTEQPSSSSESSNCCEAEEPAVKRKGDDAIYTFLSSGMCSDSEYQYQLHLSAPLPIECWSNSVSILPKGRRATSFQLNTGNMRV